MFSNLNFNCSILLDLRNLQEQVKKAFCYQKIVLTFHCLNKLFLWSQIFFKFLALNFKTFSRSLEQFFLTLGQNNFGNKIQFLSCELSQQLQFMYRIPKMANSIEDITGSGANITIKSWKYTKGPISLWSQSRIGIRAVFSWLI